MTVKASPSEAVKATLSEARERRSTVGGGSSVIVSVAKVTGLPRADRAGHSDPYVACQIFGKRGSKVKTKVVEDTEDPVFNEDLVLPDWKRGDVLVLSVYDFNKVGRHDLLATVELPSSRIFPDGLEESIQLKNAWTSAGQGADQALIRANMACAPVMDLRITVHVPTSPLGARQTGCEELSMPDREPTLEAVCGHLEEFERTMISVSHIGNFWMNPRDHPQECGSQSARGGRTQSLSVGRGTQGSLTAR